MFFSIGLFFRYTQQIIGSDIKETTPDSKSSLVQVLGWEIPTALAAGC